MEELLPPMTIRTNPVDLAFVKNPEAFAEVLRIVLVGKNVDAMVIFYLYHPAFPFGPIAEKIIEISNEFLKPIIMCVNNPHKILADEIAKLEQNRISVFPTPERTSKALSGLIRYGEMLKKVGKH